MKKLAVFLDGTWNEPDDNTNVTRLHFLVAADNAGVEQRVEYVEGVGTRFGEWIRGGVGGKGLSENVKAAYAWIAANYDDGDEIFIFGFSRGAFTARSLAGIDARCGLLYRDAAMSVDEVYARYRDKEATPRHIVDFAVKDREPLSAEDQRLVDNSRRVPIQFIGVWDTVGALGVPYGQIPGISRSQLGFHNANPSKLYKNMYHALAVDEHRAAFDATLWTRFEADGDKDFKLVEDGQVAEQRWFVGDHGDVGGSGQLALLPLAWIQEAAETCGLAFSDKVQVPEKLYDVPHGDSFARFMYGFYRMVKLNRRHKRDIGCAPVATKTGNGRSHVVNETIDASVFERWRKDSDYRPENLSTWAQTSGADPANVRGTIPAR